jgi:hypothetical protein
MLRSPTVSPITALLALLVGWLLYGNVRRSAEIERACEAHYALLEVHHQPLSGEVGEWLAQTEGRRLLERRIERLCAVDDREQEWGLR